MLTPATVRGLVKFGFVGVLNTGVSLAVFNALLLFSTVRHGWLVGLITFIAYVAGITNSFFWNKWWVFRHESEHARAEYVRFFIVSGLVALVSSGIVYVLTTYLPPPGIEPLLWSNIAVLITFPVSMLANFLAYRRLVFIETPL